MIRLPYKPKTYVELAERLEWCLNMFGCDGERWSDGRGLNIYGDLFGIEYIEFACEEDAVAYKLKWC